MNNTESDSNNKINIKLNNMYNLYFVYPEDIDAVYQKPDSRLHIKFTSRFVFDKDDQDMYTKERNIRNVYYRLPNLRLSEFFNTTKIRPDLLPGRKAEIAEIHSMAKMVLSDIDKVKDIHTKKRMLYYFRCLANATRGCDFSNDIAELVAVAAVRNNLASVTDMDVLNKKRNMAQKVVPENKNNSQQK